MDIDQFLFRYAVYLPVTLLRGQNISKHYRALDSSQHWSSDRMQELQLLKLASLLQRARASVPYYREVLSADRLRIASLRDISVLPTLDKATLKSRQENMKAQGGSRWAVRKTTGGSTGEPLTILKSRAAMAHELAATWRGYSWAGIQIGDRQARFWGVPLSMRGRVVAALTDFICNRRRFSAFGFDDASLAVYERQLVAFKPVYFYGYVSMLATFADFYVRQERSPPFRPRCIVTTSEVLTQPVRVHLQNVFGVRIFNEYGCGELGTVAHECERGSLHLSEENMIVEVLDGERACAPGEMGELVITELNNATMPLIRYRTGDFASLSANSCACGRSLRVIENLFGRAYDFVVSRSGKKFHGEMLMYIFEEAKRQERGVDQFQIRQEALDRLKILLVAGPKYTPATTQHLTLRIREFLGQDFNLAFELVDHIPREQSGKMRVIVGMPANQPGTGAV